MRCRLNATIGKWLVGMAIAVTFSAMGATQARAGGDGPTGWKRMMTRHALVYYKNIEDLFLFNESLAYFPGDLAVRSLTASEDAHGIQGILKQKLDALFERAQKILDMRKRVVRVNIRIHPDRQALHAAYGELYGDACHLRAWYLFETKTIYLDVTDTHEGIVAHEMGHHIIDHFFNARPPAATAEILARYIDANLMAP